MVSIRNKKINGKNYLYAEYSFRLPNGLVKKVSKLVKNKDEIHIEKIKNYFQKKEIEANIEYASKTYKADSVLTKEKIAKIESFKIEYKQIINNLTKKQIADILDRFTVNFTYESNAIEGNSLTLKDVTLLLTERIVPKGKDLREIYETRNTRTAHDLLFNNKIKITIPSIINLHSVLMKDTGVSEGFKKLPNYLLMRNMETTHPEKVNEEMTKLINWYLTKKGKEYPIKLSSEFHGRFEKIHPFEDGNGRVGRILINAILLENSYPPLIIRKTMRESYLNVLEAFDNGYTLKLDRFILERLDDTFNKFFRVYVKYI